MPDLGKPGSGIDFGGQCWYNGDMLKLVLAALMVAGTVGLGSAAGLGSAPIVHSHSA